MPPMKDTITAVAIDLFYRKGYFATSVSEMAGQCGIQKASIYYHYASKENILFHIQQVTMNELTAGLRGHLEGLTDVEERMRAAVRSHVRFHLNRQKETFIANSELRGLTPEHYLEIVNERDQYEQIFQQIIREGCETGVFAAADVKILSYAILTLCNAGAIWFKPGGRMPVDAIADIYEKFVLGGLTAGILTGMAPAPENQAVRINQRL
ncbi:MAG: TetR family transcriptional regulator [Desulfosarcina sp.]|nr:TetR family transcriptional regulator [Desulfobacterales bacterium]